MCLGREDFDDAKRLFPAFNVMLSHGLDDLVPSLVTP